MIVKAENLTKVYGSITALKDVTVEVPKGLTLILGPNGGGKSTFLKLALGLYKPTSGKVFLLSHDPWRNPKVRAKVGVAFDPPRFPKLTTGREWLEFIGKNRGTSDVEEVAKIFAIEEALDRKIDGYSSGMLKRLSLAQAFVGEPEVIFLDEPLANVDFESVDDIVGTIEAMKESGRSFVVTSHIWEPFEGIADYGIVISGGKVYLKGNFDEIREDVERIFHRKKNKK